MTGVLQPTPGPGSLIRHFPAFLLLIVLYGYYCAGLLQGCSRPSTPAPRLAEGFSGSASCAECHEALTRSFAGTNHARTLARVDPGMAAELPEPAELPDPDLDQGYSIITDGGLPAVEARVGSERIRQPLQWRFGSGNQGSTMVAETPDGFIESPVSFYRQRGWDFTVGFLAEPPEERRRQPAGVKLSRSAAKACFGCHTTGLVESSTGLLLESAQLGVQCESCHGPGRRHIDEARAGRPTGNIGMPGRRSGRELIHFCGSCHRAELPGGVKPDHPVAVRFAPFGLLASECFKKSGDRLTCGSCHDPHTNVVKQTSHYNKVCASCHTGAVRQPLCPVQPRGDCVACHMPREIVQRNSIFTDHRIRVVRPGSREAKRRGWERLRTVAAALDIEKR